MQWLKGRSHRCNIFYASMIDAHRYDELERYGVKAHLSTHPLTIVVSGILVPFFCYWICTHVHCMYMMHSNHCIVISKCSQMLDCPARLPNSLEPIGWLDMSWKLFPLASIQKVEMCSWKISVPVVCVCWERTSSFLSQPQPPVMVSL